LPQKQFTYTYDKNGNVLTAGDGNIDYSYQYDKTNLMERVDRVGGGLPKISLEYFYDEIGNLTQADEYVAGQINASTIYKYEDDRYLNTSIIQSRPSLADKKVVFDYDQFGQNTGVDRFVSDVLAVGTTNSYDEFGRLVGIEHVNGLGAVIGSSGYEFDDLDRLTKETRDGVSRDFGYDAIDQIKTVSGSNTESYDYDLNGNRLSYALDSANRVVFDGTYRYTYDSEGNRTKRVKVDSGVTDVYEWDNRNRLVAITTTDLAGLVIQAVAYEYDVDNQRVSKTVVTAQGQIVEKYVIDRDQITFVTDELGNEAFHYLYGLNVDQVLAQDSPTGMVWSLSDRLGSIDLLTDASGNVVDKRTFDSFGNLLEQTNPLVAFRYGYTGREFDAESGLHFNRARYYDPGIGRFISVDPMSFSGGDTNLYRYVSNSPTQWTDPTGKLAFLPILAIMAIGALAAGTVNVIHQNLEIAEGSRKDFSLGELGLSIGIGAFAAPLLASAPAWVPTGLAALGAVKGTYDVFNGKPLSGAFDAITSIFSLGLGSGGGPGLFGGRSLAVAGGGSFASAGTASKTGALVGDLLGASVIGGGFSHGVSDIFQHFLAMSESEKNGDLSLPSGSGSESKENEISSSSEESKSPESISDVSKNLPTSYGKNAETKFRKHVEQMRRTTGVNIGKLKSPDSQQQIRSVVDDIVSTGETKQIPWGVYSDAIWSKKGDAIVIRQSNGEFVTFLEAGKEGALKWNKH
jgi:RHS repeat-associated protein